MCISNPAGTGYGERCSGFRSCRIVVGEHDRQGRWPAQLGSFSGRVGMAQNGAPTHEIECQGRWKQGGGMVGRYTRGESAGSALRYL